MEAGVEEALGVQRGDGRELLDLGVVEDAAVERRVADLAEEARAGGVLADDDLVEGVDSREEDLAGQVRLQVAVDVDLDGAVADPDDDVVPAALVPVPVSGEDPPLAPAAQDPVLDSLFGH